MNQALYAHMNKKKKRIRMEFVVKTGLSTLARKHGGPGPETWKYRKCLEPKTGNFTRVDYKQLKLWGT
jgi:hypothetical protein